MTQHTTTVEMARAFTEAWTSRDYATAASYLDDGVIFDGPNNHLTDKAAYMTFLERFASGVTSARILAAYGDASEALVMYEVTNQAGTWTCSELLTFDGEKIQKDVLTFSLNAR